MRTNATLVKIIIREIHPDAIRLKYDGECPDCHFYALWSYVLPEFDKITSDGTYQQCGFYCVNCEWGNAGARLISQIDIDAHSGAGIGGPV